MNPAALILPNASVDKMLRQRIRHTLARRGIEIKQAARAAGCDPSTVQRWTSLHGSYRRGLTADAIDKLLDANGIDADELLRPVISGTMRDYLSDVRDGAPPVEVPLQDLALLGHNMGLLEVRGTEGEPDTYRLHLTAAGSRALI